MAMAGGGGGGQGEEKKDEIKTKNDRSTQECKHN